MTWDAELTVAVRASRAAEAVHREGRTSPLAIDTKSSPIDLVTQVDKDSEARVRQVILSAFPGDAIRGEEEGETGASERVWIVDPLDGTVNYAHGFPIYCVSIALTVSGERVVGVVLDTVHGELFTAVRGGGAHLNGGVTARLRATARGSDRQTHRQTADRQETRPAKCV